MDERELKARTLKFGLWIMRLVDDLPKTTSGRAIGNQQSKIKNSPELLDKYFKILVE